jgi:hypothetical protein
MNAKVDGPGGTVQVFLDNTVYMVASVDFQELTWNSSILDPSIPHTISIIKPFPDDGRSLSLYSLPVTFPDLPIIDAPSAPGSTQTETLTPNSTEAETPTKQTGGHPGLTATTKAVIAGTLVAAACLGLLGALGIYFWRRRNKHNATLDPFRKVEGEISLFPLTDALYGEFVSVFSSLDRGLTAPSAQKDRFSQFVGEGGVKAETARVRNGGRLNGGTDSTPERRPDPGEGTPVFPLEDSAPSQPPPGSLSDHLSAPPPYVP